MILFSTTLHKLLVNPNQNGRNIVVDHRDGDRLNNQKNNLRVTTHANNMRNRKVSEGGTSNYKGVSWEKKLDKWRAQICYNKKMMNLGYFSNEIAAANCYNYWAEYYFESFALLNEVSFMDKEEWESHRIIKNKTSKYKGVSRVGDKWLAQIFDKGKLIKIDLFDTEDQAAIAYNEKARELRGSKANLNIIQ